MQLGWNDAAGVPSRWCLTGVLPKNSIWQLYQPPGQTSNWVTTENMATKKCGTSPFTTLSRATAAALLVSEASPRTILSSGALGHRVYDAERFLRKFGPATNF